MSKRAWLPIGKLREPDIGFDILVQSDTLVHPDFNPDGIGVATAYWNDGGDTVEFVIAVWNNDADCWHTVDRTRDEIAFWQPMPAAPGVAGLSTAGQMFLLGIVGGVTAFLFAVLLQAAAHG